MTPIQELPLIEDLVFKGIVSRIQDLFGIKQVHFIATNDKIRQLTLLANKTGETVKYPIIFVSLDSGTLGISTNSFGSNVKSTARHGQYVKLDESNRSILKVNTIPVQFSFKVSFIANDFQTAKGFLAAWMASSIHNRFNFTITYFDFPYDIGVKGDESFSTPSKDYSVDAPSMFEYEASLLVSGYMTDVHRDGSSKIPIVSSTKINTTMLSEIVNGPVVTIENKFIRGL